MSNYGEVIFQIAVKNVLDVTLYHEICVRRGSFKGQRTPFYGQTSTCLYPLNALLFTFMHLLHLFYIFFTFCNFIEVLFYKLILLKLSEKF